MSTQSDPTPWRVGEWNDIDAGFEILDGTGRVIAVTGRSTLGDGTCVMTSDARPNAELIVRAVNDCSARASQPAPAPALTEEQEARVHELASRCYRSGEADALSGVELLEARVDALESGWPLGVKPRLEASSLSATEAKPGTLCQFCSKPLGNPSEHICGYEVLAAPPPSPDRGTATCFACGSPATCVEDCGEPIRSVFMCDRCCGAHDQAKRSCAPIKASPSPAPEAAPTAEETTPYYRARRVIERTGLYAMSEKLQSVIDEEIQSAERAAESRGAARAREETEELRGALRDLVKWYDGVPSGAPIEGIDECEEAIDFARNLLGKKP